MTAVETVHSEIFKDFSPNSKVWIYTANRSITQLEAERIKPLIKAFTNVWTAHDKALKACGDVLYSRFIILAVDESQTTASGCSIDKSTHFIKSIETLFSLNLFNRLELIYQHQEKQKSIALKDLAPKIADGEISMNTLIYDSTLTQLGKLQSEFIKEAGQSWLVKYIK